MKKIFFGLMAAAGLFSACSDVEYEEAPATSSQTVSNLTYNVQEGTRHVTLNWTNPSVSNLFGIAISQDAGTPVLFDSVFNSYYINKAPINTLVSYTVKARYKVDGDTLMSGGQTVSFTLPYEVKKVDGIVGMLVPNDYATGSADEKAAADWFKANYVDTGKGFFMTPSNLDNLDVSKIAGCWVMCDRVGIGAGYDKLPADLVSNATLEALKAFAADGGNLFLTNHATQLVVALERTTYSPVLFADGAGGYNPDIWGVHPVIGQSDLGEVYDHRGHEIYTGMEYHPAEYAGIYRFIGAGVKGDHNCMWDMNAISDLTENPNKIKDFEEKTNSTVLGTWNHVVDYCCAGIVDFHPTTTFAGRILAVGLAAYEWNLGDNANTEQAQLERFTENCLKYIGRGNTKQVAMLLPNDYATGSADEKAAADWFQANYVDNGQGVIITPATIDQLDIEAQTMCWVMCDRVGIGAGFEKLPGDMVSTATLEALKAFTADGGNLLLTNHATQLAVALERTTYSPVLFADGAGGENPDIWGVHPIIGQSDLGEVYDHKDHDIYWGMTYEPTLYAGIYCFEGAGIKGDHNCMWDMNAISDLTENPNKIKDFEDKTNSTVLGTWNHVVDYCCAGIVDFHPTTTFRSRILAVGLAAYEWDLGGVANTKQAELERFTANCINYLR